LALALEKVCDSYELGDYSRNEFLTRKSKWEEKINDTKSEIARHERELKPQE
jgi:site-specific DNA recombinase